MKTTLTLLILLLSLLPAANAAQSAGSVGSAEHCTIYNLSKIIAVINAGTEEICIVFDADTPANTAPVVHLRASGPDNALGVAFSQTWSVISTQGCTAVTLNQASGASAATSWSNANIPLTFDAGSHQCTGIAQYTLVVASINLLTWQGGWDIDVLSEASYVFNCDHTGTTAETTYPGRSTCNTPTSVAIERMAGAENGYSGPEAVKSCSQPRYVNAEQAPTVWLTSGVVQACLNYAPIINPTATGYPASHLALQSIYPPLVSGGSSVVSSATNLAGCTAVVSGFNYNPNVGGNGVTSGRGTGDYLAYQNFDFTITAPTCTGYIHVELTAGTPTNTILSFDLPFQIRVNTQQIMGEQCAAGNYDLSVGRFTSCANPTLNAAVTGSLGVTGTLTVHNDGTLTVTNTGGQTMTLSGAITVHADGSITVTNAGGQAISFSGPLTVHQDPICTSAAHCFVDSTSSLTIGNATQNVSLTTPPGFWELFGPLLLAVAFVVLISYAGIWIVPGGAALGMAIFLHAFKQPYQFLILLQAVAGISLAIFCLIAIGIRVLGAKPKKEARRFFQ